MSQDNDNDLKKIYPYYVERTNYYKSIYGNNTILLMQVGSFYEIYSNCNTDNIDIKTLSEITQLSIANKKIGYFMAGFKVEILHKYANMKLGDFDDLWNRFKESGLGFALTPIECGELLLEKKWGIQMIFSL